MKKNLKEIIENINNKLRSYGKAAVKESQIGDNPIVRYGYKPQYIFDAINEELGPENWRYEIASKEILNTQVVVEVKLFIMANGEWLLKGSQFGQAQIVKKNAGDAHKGAVTDALGKVFATGLSIGTDAYRGLLKSVYVSSARNTTAAKAASSIKTSPKTTSPKTADATNKTSIINQENDLPEIAGVSYQMVGDVCIASGNQVYDKKDLLKAVGFKWYSDEKHWARPLAA